MTRYCGTFFNQTLNKGEYAEIDVAPGGGFAGLITIGPKLQGGGPFTGAVDGANCTANAAGPPAWRLTGTCSPTALSGSFVFQDQVGIYRFARSTAPCAVAPPSAPPPPPRAPPAPPPPPRSAPPAPPPPSPRSPPPAPMTRFCGTIYNQTLNKGE
jgi:hypothetical protein